MIVEPTYGASFSVDVVLPQAIELNSYTHTSADQGDPMIETTNSDHRRPGFSHEQLAQAFDRVRDPRDWRGPVRAEIPIEMRALVAEAVICFTATDPVFEPADRPELLLDI